MMQLSGCDALLPLLATDISMKMNKTRSLRTSSKLARAIEDGEHVRSALRSIGYEMAADQ